MKKILIVSIGGTISMTKDNSGGIVSNFSISEFDLIKKGVITSGFLNAPKAMILLSVLTGCKLKLKKFLIILIVLMF